MNEHLYNETQTEENFTEEEIIKQDPWLQKDYVGKPLSVKSLRIYMNKGYNVNSAYHSEQMDRWIDDEAITHPYIAINIAQINPRSL